MNSKGRTGTVVMLVAILISVSGGFLVFRSLDGKDAAEEVMIDTSPSRQQLSTLSHSFLSSSEDMDLEQIEDDLEQETSRWISSSMIDFDHYTATVLSVEVNASTSRLLLDIPVPPGGIMGEGEALVQNSMLYGSSGSLPLLPSIKTRTDIVILLEPLDEGSSVEKTISYETEVVDPQRGLSELIDLIEKDMNGWGSGMARDMEYMLNTLVRIRTKNDWGAGTMQSDLNVLNEGDIEIAFNIALALRICRWTGQIPEELVSDIDTYFLDQDVSSETNPTGLRIWGEAEKDNYREVWRMAGTQLRRYLPDILGSVLNAGHGDPADIFARYLFLERWGGKTDLNMLDMRSAMEDKDLLSEREPANHDDPYAMSHHLSFPDREGIEVSPRNRLDDEENRTLFRFEPIIEPYQGYMIIGRDLFIEGLTEPHAWFSDSNPDLDPSELTAVGGLPVRCSAIPPPQKPPSHNYRVQWDLRLSGDMELTAESNGYGGNVLTTSKLWEDISFDFPIRVITWFEERPSNDGYEFININTGRIYWTTLMTGWHITPESNATEVFEESVFGELRQGLEILTSQLRSMEWYLGMEVMDTLSMRKLFQSQTLTSNHLLEVWSRNPDIWTYLDGLWTDQIEGAGVQVEDLGKIRTEGHMIKLGYSDIKDRLDLVSDLPGGQIRISFYGMKGGEHSIDAGIETLDGPWVDLRPQEGDFSIKGPIGGVFIDDGPLDPDPPSEEVSKLVIRSGWKAQGPTFDMGTWASIGQYVEMDGSLRENELRASFMLAGDNSQDPGSIMLDAADELATPGMLSEGTVAEQVHDIGAFALSRDLWFGFSATQSGLDRAHPISRELLIKVSDAEILDMMISRGYIMDLFRETVWGASVQMDLDLPLENGDKVDIILLETIPSWTTSLPPDTGSKELLMASHVSVEMDDDTILPGQSLNLFYYDGTITDYDGQSSGWSSSGIELPVSLW